jgi:pimeloyl-ACP methyl ester carboxylesterase
VTRGAALALLVLVAAACAAPVGVRRVDERRVHRQLTASVLTGDQPSSFSLQMLQRLKLYERFRADRPAVLAELHAGLAEDVDLKERLYALAELSFQHAERSGDRRYYRAAAAYAYAFLSSGEAGLTPVALDPRNRVSADLYNRGLTAGMTTPDGDYVEFDEAYELPFGTLEVEIDPGGFYWGDHRLDRFVPVAELEVRGLRNRYRQAGIGAPLAASVLPAREDGSARDAEWIGAGTRVPVTAFLRFEQPLESLRAGRMRARLELYAADVASRVMLGGQPVPLETEFTATLAYRLAQSRIWDFELAGFRSADLNPPPIALGMLHPYRPGRIPVVFVHGTASSAARWAEMTNELSADPLLRERCQFWYFTYNTGNPVLYSAWQLRTALVKAVNAVDPEAEDATLRQMVVIGHSQGGLLTKLTAVDSGDRFWIDRVSLDELDMSEETRRLLRDVTYVKPLPFVRRVIFIATPHRGSYVAANRMVGWLVSKLVTTPRRLTTLATEVVLRNPEGDARRRLIIPRSVDEMRPQSRFSRTLPEIPLAPGVAAHSIIPVIGGQPLPDGKDGVVEYASAHVDGVESEKVVDSPHSTQDHPETIGEVRRILRRHLELNGLSAAAAPPGSGARSPETSPPRAPAR